jgi:hypothetical protein
MSAGVPPIAAELMARLVPGFIASRGYHSIYREHETNHCPGCGRAHWIIGRITAECAFCSTAIPLEASFVKADAPLERPRLVRAPAAARSTNLRLVGTFRRAA